jgi:hypothetical protein
MGSSKVVLVGATSLIVGIYALSIKRVETDYVGTCARRVQTVQADRLTEAGLRLAVDAIANTNGSLKKLTKIGQKVLGGTVNYDISNGTSKSADLTVTVSIGGVTKSAIAHVEKLKGNDKILNGLKSIHRGHWIVKDYYLQKG